LNGGAKDAIIGLINTRDMHRQKPKNDKNDNQSD